MEWLNKLFFKQYTVADLDFIKFLIGLDETATVKEVIKRVHRHISDPETQAIIVRTWLWWRIKNDIVSIEEVITELYNYCSNNKRVKCKNKRSFMECLLRNLLEIMAEYEYRHKDQVRNILTLMYQLYPNAPETIPGQVFFLEKVFFKDAHCKDNITEEKNTEKKQEVYKKLYYMVDMVACWSPPNIQLLDSDNERYATYLDFPLTDDLQRFIDFSKFRNFRGVYFNLMSCSIYGLCNVDLMLYLLRCGTSVSGCMLWPVGFGFTHLFPDLKNDFQRLFSNPEGSMRRIIRYFCRTKRWIYLHLVREDGADSISVKVLKRVRQKNTLILPERLEWLVPLDRYKEPSKLLHQCRLTIRKQLQKAEQLPYGPQKLPLPASLRNYADLLED